MATNTVRVLLVRHGQSEWNALGRWQGIADSPLSALGLDQATTSAVRLAALGVSFGSVWSSDLARAHRTAVAIAESLGIDADDVGVDPRLREADAGEWQGLTHADIDRDWPGYLAAQRRPPRFEPYESVVSRALDALHAIALGAIVHHPDGSVADAAVVVVAHSGLIRSLIRHIDGTDPRIPNLGGVWLDVIVDRAAPLEPTCVLIEVFDPHGVDLGIGVEDLGEEPGAAVTPPPGANTPR